MTCFQRYKKQGFDVRVVFGHFFLPCACNKQTHYERHCTPVLLLADVKQQSKKQEKVVNLIFKTENEPL
jgi:hypothetical protein